MITRGRISSKLRSAISGTASIELVETFDVMDNYYVGPVHLYRVMQPTD